MNSIVSNKSLPDRRIDRYAWERHIQTLLIIIVLIAVSSVSTMVLSIKTRINTIEDKAIAAKVRIDNLEQLIRDSVGEQR